ncbi:cofactor-independent phosphoglycerate mutase [candidate division WOR-1 bacterium RIFOXYA2_FULL_36_21]|uniref:Cofactor-independent phosphoglycerate mutase n=1 Tax=candidate division WOR-1 bacterium RIFOXYB2_FULL_36_35 TaxID=1802578 RepID=A0A1F4S5M9_UNCSA|nr:MAG: cofactor-independent phosphoglycerate mutase [candidate division WOR-1 bacterium RIFOXYA2_FULL_36_21]OGC15745.1 MAG: cofactor-independent phosphoglycerate mutase [candidate division WOR-1 bacterium RIFOXYB2_FULL_36_35]OGC21100.1 MAG: cofactor-independent phosphoglycerate mutase [candidate division WOR-1 bacterium RIFOXYA12_FULL_36_13]
MKYLILIGDGMSDLPLKELNFKTPLETAKTPNMDFLAKNGMCGWVSNVPKDISPGSDVAAMSIFGYDPKKYYTGRGPLEAASLGVKLKESDIAFRCNLVTIKDGLMESFTADHISTEEARKILTTLNQKMGHKGIRFYTGLSYRHLLVINPTVGNFVENLPKLDCTPPHDITGKKVELYLPQGPGEHLIKSLMKESIMHLLEHKVNITRIENGKKPATMIWLWGQGKKPQMQLFKKEYNKSAAVITAVHLLKGLGKIIGAEIPYVKGATGFIDTNYKGKADAALKMIKRHDVVFVHVEAPDECGHMGDIKRKIKAIEDFDEKIVGYLLKSIKNRIKDFKIMVLPDHPTPIKLMTHTSDPVPFVIYNNVQNTGNKTITKYNEKELKKSKIKIDSGHKLLKKFFQ